MNEDFYENEIRKNMNQIDTLNSKQKFPMMAKNFIQMQIKWGKL